MEKWFSLSEALEVKKMEVEIESHVLSGVHQVLDDSIEHVIKDDKEESQLLHKKKKILAEELQELLDLVKQKEAEISENDSKIENVEKRMADAVSSFHEAQTNIHSKSENIQSGLSQLELESDDLARKKKEIDDFHHQEDTRGSKIKELSQISADEARMYQEVIHLRKSLIEFISKSREDKTRLAKTEQKLFDDVQILKQDISAVRASLQVSPDNVFYSNFKLIQSRFKIFVTLGSKIAFQIWSNVIWVSNACSSGVSSVFVNSQYFMWM